jgi:hypothetical protein
MDAEAVVRASNDTGKTETLDKARSDAEMFGITSTPSFLIGKTGQTPQPLQLEDPSDPAEFQRAIDTALGQGT